MPALRVQHLSKQYRLGLTHAGSIRELLNRATGRLFGRGDATVSPQRSSGLGRLGDGSETFWALDDVSFEVQPGEVVGIIGRNGAGKSTLLKILSRITLPTKGRVELFGRVASLLEVGTGFHPELTGRENIFLNGAILGMTKADIRRKFDEIVAFAEVEQFVDTPVKRYSSGMYVRLAFAVAAHLDPEILIIDEVLAVGDTNFQTKCLGKMQDVAGSGRTVLFVSHNMGALSDLCPKSMLLSDGHLTTIDRTPAVISTYLAERAQHVRAEMPVNGVGDGNWRLSYVEMRDERGRPASTFRYGDTICIRLGIQGGDREDVCIGVTIRNGMGQRVLHFFSLDDQSTLMASGGKGCVELRFQNILNKGDYYIAVWIGTSHLQQYDYAADCLRFGVDTSCIGISHRNGVVIQPGAWCTVDE